jgi:hypothetical protein
MIASKLIELIELHADHLASDVARDLATNERTLGFHDVPLTELTHRMFEIVHHLGDWIGDPRSEPVQREFTEWGARRFDQAVPLSEIVYGIIILKAHLRRYIRDHGLVDAAFPHAEREYVLPMHLHSLQELTEVIDRFFDEGLYALTRGYEAQARRAPHSSVAVAAH